MEPLAAAKGSFPSIYEPPAKPSEPFCLLGEMA